MAEAPITRTEAMCAEEAIMARTRRGRGLLPSDAILLKVLDWYKKQMGWDDEE
jgi:hypothetical protein